MPTFKVDPRELGKDLERDYAKMLEVSIEAIQKTVGLHGPRIAQAVVGQLTPPPVDRGTYRRSFKAQKTRFGSIFYNFAAHAPIIEDGRRPGSKLPPIDVILAWVKRKRLGTSFVGPVRKAPRAYSTLGGRKVSISSRRLAIESQQRWIALNIARKIAARGLPARHVLAIVEETLTPIVEGAIDEAIGKI